MTDAPPAAGRSSTARGRLHHQCRRWTRPAPHKEVYEKALNLVVSTRKDVFSLDKEVDGKPIDPKLKEEYGNDGFGRAALLARMTFAW